jgi:hypothetical protein
VDSGACGIKVIGDATVDWLLVNPSAGQAKSVDLPEMWWSGITCRAIAHEGGAALLSRLIEKAIATSSEPEGVAPPLAKCELAPSALSDPSDPTHTRTYTSWAPFPGAGGKGSYSWRIEEFWGVDPATSPLGCLGAAPEPERTVLVIDDSNLGFRDASQAWPAAVSRPDGQAAPEWVLLKMCAPLGQGPLWSRLADTYADRLTVIVPINDLRKGGGQVGTALSWEQIFEELDSAVRAHELSRAAEVVVTLGTSGAISVPRNGDSTLVFDQLSLEGDWEKQHPGELMGYSTCVTASLAMALARAGGAVARETVAEALSKGLAGARQLHLSGYEEHEAPTGTRIAFPYTGVAQALGAPPEAYAAFEWAGGSAGALSAASILSQRLSGDVQRTAARVVVEGPEKVLAGVPVESAGAWSSVDRVEIESMRSVRNILDEYVAQFLEGGRLERPLSIAVFGPPGSGKSFAIKQMAKALLPGELTALEFNLSQFGSADELPDAFHEVRDVVLSQRLPLVFFDEFDTPLAGQPLGWLRYFLAPMQDGKFREEDDFHPIGPAVFVFAGGTSSTLADFATTRDEAAERAAKKPDFLSRLRGYANILGPNPVGESDELYVIRRAFLLRSLLKMKVPQLVADGRVSIDPGVLRAFLAVDRYLHGARSMEAIIDMSALAGKLVFERSSLPAPHQLALHVDAGRFLDLVRRSDGNPET